MELLSGLFSVVVTILLVMWGISIATGKGYSPWLGGLVGFFFPIIGHIVLYLIPDQGYGD